jgi:hypothetical protein
MAERGHRVYATHTVRVSTEIRAPLKYVYEWCTDYRTDDWRISTRRPHSRFRVVKVSPHQVLRIRLSSNATPDPDVCVDVVRLSPPHSWHTNQIDARDLEAVDYHLTRLGRDRTRIDLLVTERWMFAEHPTRAQVAQQVRTVWARFAALIEADYRRGRPARG